MAALPQCPNCHCEMPADFPSGLCPDCLFAAGQNGDDEVEIRSDFNAVNSMTPRPGAFVPPSPALLDKYFPQLEIVALLGQGGMGAVYAARQKKLDRLVALKIIRPESANDPAFAERFNREARTLARLNHPHIVAVHDFGEVLFSRSDADGEVPLELYYFVMEYVDGANLRQLLSAGNLSPTQSMAIIPQVCDALQFAHDEGIVHRDIKPENILVDCGGRVKIADFGLAKLASQTQPEFTLTATHQVMGTPRYMAPEQMEGSRSVDHRADIYSLGVVFYEMLTGHLPMGQFDPPSKENKVDTRIDDVVLRALAREPQRRYQHASEMSNDVNIIRGIYSSDALASIQQMGGIWPGASTIFENAMGKMAGGVRPGVIRSFFASPVIPGIVTGVLGVCGALSTFLVWGYVAGPGEEWQYIHGYEDFGGCLIAILFLTLTFTMFVTTTSRKRPAWRPWANFGTAVGVFFLASIFVNDNFHRTRDHMMYGLVVLMGICLMLVFVGAWDLRCWLHRPRDPAQWNSLQQAVNVARRSVPYSSSMSTPGVSHNSGRDWVTLTRHQVENERLPDICMICGAPAFDRINRTFTDYGLSKEYNEKGFLRPTRMRVACSVCPKHSRYWRRLPKVAIGGLIAAVVFSVGVFFALADAFWREPELVVGWTVAVSILAAIVWIGGVIYVASTRISAESITDQSIKLQRVSPIFAAVISQQSSANALPPSSG